MKTSQYGLHFVANEEGIRMVPYKDQAGLWTVGVGHLLQSGEVIPGLIESTIWAGEITYAQAMTMLAVDIGRAEVEVGVVRTPLNQNQFDACVSLTFNIGTGGFETSSVRYRIDQGDWAGAADAFLLWDKRRPRPGELVRDIVTGAFREPRPGELVVDGGLLARRNRERDLFLGTVLE